jgi:hypothetical protein
LITPSKGNVVLLGKYIKKSTKEIYQKIGHLSGENGFGHHRIKGVCIYNLPAL